MIFGTMKNREQFSFLERGVLECLEYAACHDLKEYDTGSHKIDGDRLFVNIVQYKTTSAEERFWEAHKDYLDIHVMLCGQEQIDTCFIHNMKIGEYVKEEDFLPMEGEKNASVILKPGDFLLCYPQDGHRTAVAVSQPEDIKKAIFKLRIQG